MESKKIQIKPYFIAEIDDRFRGPEAFRLKSDVIANHQRQMWRQISNHGGLIDSSGKHEKTVLFQDEDLLDKIAGESFIADFRPISVVDTLNNNFSPSQIDFLKTECDVLIESGNAIFFCFNDSIVANLTVAPGVHIIETPQSGKKFYKFHFHNREEFIFKTLLETNEGDLDEHVVWNDDGTFNQVNVSEDAFDAAIDFRRSNLKLWKLAEF